MGRSHDVKRVTISAGCLLRREAVVRVSFVYCNQVSDLKHAFFYTLQFIACARQHEQYVEVDHLGECYFRLTDSDRFNHDTIKAGRFTQ